MDNFSGRKRRTYDTEAHFRARARAIPRRDASTGDAFDAPKRAPYDRAAIFRAARGVYWDQHPGVQQRYTREEFVSGGYVIERHGGGAPLARATTVNGEG